MRILPLVIAAALTAGAAQAQPAQAQPPQPPSAKPAAVSGAEFLAKNAREPGVQTWPSGLQVKVVASGPAGGPSPKPGDVVKVHYEGKLPSGEVFDSSFARGRPALMPLEGLVQAWMEALPKMRVGDEWILYAPPALGYGPDGQGPIPPNAVLIFRVKLLGLLSAD
jgi:FKBP-type peptidyl-prolyl cis-trans isomerase